jgi:hypothetical protein
MREDALLFHPRGKTHLINSKASKKQEQQNNTFSRLSGAKAFVRSLKSASNNAVIGRQRVRGFLSTYV